MKNSFVAESNLNFKKHFLKKNQHFLVKNSTFTQNNSMRAVLEVFQF